MSKVTIVSSVTYAIEVDIPLGFLADERRLSRQYSKELKAALRGSVPEGAPLRDVQATTVVVTGRPW